MFHTDPAGGDGFSLQACIGCSGSDRGWTWHGIRIAQGIEAGGHVRGTFGLLALLEQVLGAVDVPVVAAGGIGSGRAMAAVMAAGADGVRVGTRFLAVEEAEAHPDYVKALIDAEAQDTVYTEAFSVGWPDAPHRVLRSSLDAAQSFKGEIVGSAADTWI